MAVAKLFPDKPVAVKPKPPVRVLPKPVEVEVKAKVVTPPATVKKDEPKAQAHPDEATKKLMEPKKEEVKK